MIVLTSTVLDFHQFLFSRIGYAGYLTIWISLYPASCYTIISWVFFFFFSGLSLNFDSLSLKCVLFSLTLNNGGLVALTSLQFKSKCWVLTSHYFLNFRLIYLILCQIASPVTPDTTHLNLNSSWLSLVASSSVFFLSLDNTITWPVFVNFSPATVAFQTKLQNYTRFAVKGFLDSIPLLNLLSSLLTGLLKFIAQPVFTVQLQGLYLSPLRWHLHTTYSK